MILCVQDGSEKAPWPSPLLKRGQPVLPPSRILGQCSREWDGIPVGGVD